MDVLDKLSLDIITLDLEGIGCTEMIQHIEDLALFNNVLVSSLPTDSVFTHLAC